MVSCAGRSVIFCLKTAYRSIFGHNLLCQVRPAETVTHPGVREIATISIMEAEIRAGRIVDGMTFSQKVWALTSRIPAGRVTTYSEIARALGTKAYRAVGNALNKNPYAPGVLAIVSSAAVARSPALPAGWRRSARCCWKKACPCARQGRCVVDLPLSLNCHMIPPPSCL